MAKLLQIAQLGSNVLRKKAREVKKTKAASVQSLINDLLVTVKEVNGVGIAAPQVHESLRVIIVASFPNSRYPRAPKMKPTPMINPKLIWHSDVIEKDWEGCLSVPGIRGLVPRFKEIKVEYLDRKGKKVEKKFEDFIARIFQHEVDHLDGIIFLDRLDTTKEIITDKEYLKLVKK